MNLFIDGDSWGAGCWRLDKKTGEYGTFHEGFACWAKQDFNFVNNLAIGGKDLNKILSSCSSIPYNTTFRVIFVTEPLRSLSFKYFTNFNSLVEAQTVLFDSFLKSLNSIGSKFYLLGGVYEIDPSLVEPYDNIEVVIPSITKFIYPEYNHPRVWLDDSMLDSLDKNISEEFLDALLEQKYLRNEIDSDKYKEYFYPDGYHPNVQGSKKIYDYVHKEVFYKRGLI